MKKFIKVMLIITGIIILLLGAATAAVYIMFPPEKIRQIVIKEASEATGREIGLGELKFNIFKGIEISNVYIKEAGASNKENFLQAESVIFKYNLLALLKKDLIINKIELVSPYVKIIKQPDGKFSFSDMLNGEKKAAKQKTAKKEKKADKPLFNNIIVTGVAVKKGNFIYSDVSKAKAVNAQLKDFNFSTGNLLLSAAVPVDIKSDFTAVYGSYVIPVDLKSQLRLDLKSKDADIAVGKLVIAGTVSEGNVKLVNFKDVSGNISTTAGIPDIMKMLPEKTVSGLKDVSLSGNIKNSIKFSSVKGKFVFSDSAAVEKAEVLYRGKKAVENFNASAEITSSYNLKSDMDFKLAGSNVNIKIKGSNVTSLDDGVFNIDIYSPKLAVEYLLALIPQKDKSAPKKQVTKTKTAAAKTKKAIKAPGTYLNIKADAISFKEIEIGKTIANVRLVNNKFYMEASAAAYSGNINSSAVSDINKGTYSFDFITSQVQMTRLIDDVIAVLPRKDASKKTFIDDLKGKVQGKAAINSKFSGTTFNDILHTVKGSGNFSVTNGLVGPLEMGKDLAKKTGISDLGNAIEFDTMSGVFSMASGKIDVKNFRLDKGADGKAGDIKVKGAGWITVDRALDFKAETDISPKLSKQFEQNIAANFGIKDAGYAYDKEGWMPFDFRVYNTIAQKKYDYSQARMMENIKRNLSKKLEEEGKKYMEKEGGKLIKQLFGK
ncbi:MAG: AsmA family protein [Candidatus Goldbacteria bacterium]|nr:AsmA family protein [Candidatus Goldiibacteriota bacterium]